MSDTEEQRNERKRDWRVLFHMTFPITPQPRWDFVLGPMRDTSLPEAFIYSTKSGEA